MWTNSTSNLYRVNEVHNSLRAARVDLRIATCDCGCVRVWVGVGICVHVMHIYCSIKDLPLHALFPVLSSQPGAVRQQQ